MGFDFTMSLVGSTFFSESVARKVDEFQHEPVLQSISLIVFGCSLHQEAA